MDGHIKTERGRILWDITTWEINLAVTRKMFNQIIERIILKYTNSVLLMLACKQAFLVSIYIHSNRVIIMPHFV